MKDFFLLPGRQELYMGLSASDTAHLDIYHTYISQSACAHIYVCTDVHLLLSLRGQKSLGEFCKLNIHRWEEGREKQE